MFKRTRRGITRFDVWIAALSDTRRRWAIFLAGLVVVLILALLFGCARQLPTSTGASEPVVTGTTWAPSGAHGYCARNREELRCRHTIE
jgi:hypothetical protein